MKMPWVEKGGGGRGKILEKRKYQFFYAWQGGNFTKLKEQVKGLLETTQLGSSKTEKKSNGGPKFRKREGAEGRSRHSCGPLIRPPKDSLRARRESHNSK